MRRQLTPAGVHLMSRTCAVEAELLAVAQAPVVAQPGAANWRVPQALRLTGVTATHSPLRVGCAAGLRPGEP